MKITIIGSGNVGGALALSLKRAGHSIVEVSGRNRKTILALAKKIDAKPVYLLKNLSSVSDLYIVCVDDRYIAAVVDQLIFHNKPVVHTSGATSIKVLSKFKQHGVFYPVNSVSNIKFSFETTPFCIDANEKSLLSLLKSLVRDLEGEAHIISDKQRLTIHLAAVFANNFSNSLFHAAYNLMQKEKIPFRIIEPLIIETADKTIGQKPADVQTGPAVRNDEKTIEKHLALLKNKTDLKKVYQIMTALIKKQSKS